MPSLRLFLAIETPKEVVAQLTAVQQTLKSINAEVKWESSNKFHITTNFLGPVSPDLLPGIVSSIRGVLETQPPFRIRYTGLGCFPERRNPKVIWAGVQTESGTVKEIHAEVERVLIPLGIPSEGRDYHPHVTLGRVKGPKNVKSLIATMETVTFESPPVEIQQLVLMKSELEPGGSIYTIIETLPLRK